MSTETPAVGTLLTANDPAPPDDTPLLGPDGKVEKFIAAEIGGQWRKYATWAGPFVVAPDYDAIVGRHGDAEDD